MRIDVHSGKIWPIVDNEGKGAFGMKPETLDKLLAVVDAHMERWIRRSVQEPEAKPDLSEEYIAWDGKRVAIISHGYDNVWVTSNGLPFDFTHWQYLPKPPEDG